MKILHIGKFHPIRGGVEKVMLDLTEGLSGRGIECDMLCAAQRGSYTVTLNDHARILAVRTLARVKSTMLAPAMILRMRRITGYLTGDLSSWNSAKRAEERDRVKHL